MQNNIKYAIIGAGNGGQSMAGHLALMGYEVRLYDIDSEKINIIKGKGGVELKGSEVPNGFGKISTITTNIKEAILGAKIIMVVTDSRAHKNVAETISEHLSNGQIIILNPGNFGSLEFDRILKEKGVTKDIIIAETESLIYACRALHPGIAEIYNMKHELNLSTFPSDKNEEVLAILNKAFPQFRAGQNVLQIGLSNVNTSFHPAFSMFNAARIEYAEGNFSFYKEGATPSVVKIAEYVDKEKIEIGNAFDIKVPTSLELIRKFYNAKGKTLYEAIKTVRAYMRSKAPSSLNTRYIWEDVSMSLIPISQLGQLAKVDTFTIDTLINMGILLLGGDIIRKNQRNLISLNLEGKSIEEIKQLL